MAWSGEEYKNPYSFNPPKSVTEIVDQDDKIKEEGDLRLSQRKAEKSVTVNFCTELYSLCLEW